MRSPGSMVALAALLSSPFLIQPAVAELDVTEYETLQALPSWGYDGSFEKRSEFDLTQLNPASSETFLWGGARRGNRFPFANMTMYSDEGELILSMEKFLPMLDYVECGEKMTLAFKNKASFDHAIRAWGWVNEDETHSFIMMANHPSCGAEERQPYYILDADYDEEKNIAYLYGEERTMEEVAHTFDMDFGTAAIPGMEDSNLDSRVTFEKGFDIDMDWDFAGPVVSHDGETWPSFSIECISCGTTGQFAASGRVVWSGWSPDEVTISFAPAGLGGHADLKLNLHGTLPVSAYYVTNLVETPAWGINIPVVGHLGLTASLQMGWAIGTFTGNVTVETGAGFSLPETASAELTVSGDPDYTAGDWTPEGYNKGITVTGGVDGLTATLFTQVFAGVTFKVFKWEMGAGLTFKPLNFDMTLAGGCDNGGLDVTSKLGSVFGAFVGEFSNEFGFSIPGPTKRAGLAMTWAFWKGIWWEENSCSGANEKRADAPSLEWDRVPHVRKASSVRY
ncbi:hypothetical protein FQN54_003788 [Arachnomyces sp. PD_36]|nr:hypothetical protein FQN54_003788 [Arachnomyces sp. PD_36]